MIKLIYKFSVVYVHDTSKLQILQALENKIDDLSRKEELYLGMFLFDRRIKNDIIQQPTLQ